MANLVQGNSSNKANQKLISAKSLISSFSVEPQFRDDSDLRNISEFFQSYPFHKYFSEINPEQMLNVAKSIRILRVQSQKLLIPKGGIVNRFYIILEGYLNVNYGDIFHIQSMHLLSGDTIGSQSLIYNFQTDYSVHSGKDGCLIGYLDKDDFNRILRLHELFRIQKWLQVLRCVDLLKELSEEQILQIFFASNLVEVAPRKILYSIGSKANGFFIVLEGKLKQEKLNSNEKDDNQQDSKQKIISVGQFCGHFELIKKEEKRKETTQNLDSTSKLLYLNNGMFWRFFQTDDNKQQQSEIDDNDSPRSISPRNQQVLRLQINANEENILSREKTTATATSESQEYRSECVTSNSQVYPIQSKFRTTNKNNKMSEERNLIFVKLTKKNEYPVKIIKFNAKEANMISSKLLQKSMKDLSLRGVDTSPSSIQEKETNKYIEQPRKMTQNDEQKQFRDQENDKTEFEGQTADIFQRNISRGQQEFQSSYQKLYLTEQVKKFSNSSSDRNTQRNLSEISSKFEQSKDELLQKMEQETERGSKIEQKLKQLQTIQANSRSSNLEQIQNILESHHQITLLNQQKSPLPFNSKVKTIESLTSGYSSALPIKKQRVVGPSFKIISRTKSIHTTNANEQVNSNLFISSPHSVQQLLTNANNHSSQSKRRESNSDHHQSSDNLKPMIEISPTQNVIHQQKKRHFQSMSLANSYEKNEQSKKKPSKQILKSIQSISQHSLQYQQLQQQQQQFQSQRQLSQNFMEHASQDQSNSQQADTTNPGFDSSRQLESKKYQNFFLENPKSHVTNLTLSLPSQISSISHPQLIQSNREIRESSNPVRTSGDASPSLTTAVQIQNRILTSKNSQSAFFKSKNLLDPLTKDSINDFVKNQIDSIQTDQTSALLQKLMTNYSSRSKQGIHLTQKVKTDLLSKRDTSPRIINPPKLIQIYESKDVMK